MTEGDKNANRTKMWTRPMSGVRVCCKGLPTTPSRTEGVDGHTVLRGSVGTGPLKAPQALLSGAAPPRWSGGGLQGRPAHPTHSTEQQRPHTQRTPASWPPLLSAVGPSWMNGPAHWDPHSQRCDRARTGGPGPYFRAVFQLSKQMHRIHTEENFRSGNKDRIQLSAFLQLSLT